jgi:hypothetical protein
VQQTLSIHIHKSAQSYNVLISKANQTNTLKTQPTHQDKAKHNVAASVQAAVLSQDFDYTD